LWLAVLRDVVDLVEVDLLNGFRADSPVFSSAASPAVTKSNRHDPATSNRVRFTANLRQAVKRRRR
jgi:hypothetical protein